MLANTGVSPRACLACTKSSQQLLVAAGSDAVDCALLISIRPGTLMIPLRQEQHLCRKAKQIKSIGKINMMLADIPIRTNVGIDIRIKSVLKADGIWQRQNHWHFGSNNREPSQEALSRGSIDWCTTVHGAKRTFEATWQGNSNLTSQDTTLKEVLKAMILTQQGHCAGDTNFQCCIMGPLSNCTPPPYP